MTILPSLPFDPTTMKHILHPLSVPYIFTLVLSSFASLTNVTVDDDGGDNVTGNKILYTGPEHNTWEEGATCSCAARVKPDPSQLFLGTWHDSTFHSTDGGPKTFQFNFTGTAIYVYFVIADSFPNVTTNTNVSFFVDSSEVGFYAHAPDPSKSDFTYNVPVFVKEDLDNVGHNLTVASRGDNPSVILFDYLIYSADLNGSSSGSSGNSSGDPSSTASGSPSSSSSHNDPNSSHDNVSSSGSSKPSVGLIAGVVVASMCVLAAALAFFLVLRRRRSRVQRGGKEYRIQPATFVHGGDSPPSSWASKPPLPTSSDADVPVVVEVTLPPARSSPTPHPTLPVVRPIIAQDFPTSPMSTTNTAEPLARSAWSALGLAARSQDRAHAPIQGSTVTTATDTASAKSELAALNRQMGLLMNEVGRLREQHESFSFIPPDLPPPPRYPQP